MTYFETFGLFLVHFLFLPTHRSSSWCNFKLLASPYGHHGCIQPNTNALVAGKRYCGKFTTIHSISLLGLLGAAPEELQQPPIIYFVCPAVALLAAILKLV